MRKKITCFVLILSLFLPFMFTTEVQAATNTELNIYAIYLNSTEKGDSVLLESKGQYLLIDMGVSSQVPAIINELYTLGVTHLNVMFSHLHKDHVGGSSESMLSGLNQLTEAGFQIDTLYLADPSLTPLSVSNPKRYARLENYIQTLDNSHIQYLNVGDHIQFGDVDGNVIGPVNTSYISPDKYAVTTGGSVTASGSSIYTSYENNCSLAVIFTCGTTRYFTAGDCMEDEANALLNQYGSALDCDIMKLSHHGISAGNSTALLAAITPSYTFASNTKYTNINEETERWDAYGSSKRATKYGPCYLVGNEKKTLIYHIKNDSITLYKGTTVTPKNKVTGWLSLYGEDGTNRDHNMYYFDTDGPITGVHKIGNHYYYFDHTGRMEYGTYSNAGDYSGWHQYTGGRRFYRLSSDETYAYMSKGFDTIGGKKYYFLKNGYQMVNTTDQVVFKYLGADFYALTPESTFITSDFLDLDDFTYYFDASGKMAIDEKKYIDSEYYLFDENGHLLKPDSEDLTLITYDDQKYAMYPDGTLATDDCLTLNDNKYYVDSKGDVQIRKVISMDGKNYYFGASGKMVTDKNIKWNGKKYYCKPNGVMKLIKPKKTTKKDTKKNTKKDTRTTSSKKK